MAIAVLATLVCAVPVGAIEGPTDGPEAPVAPKPGSEDAKPGASTTTTTSTTRPDGETPPDADGDPAAPPVDLTPTAGPPELAKRGVILPDDSLVAATEELNLERAKIDLLGARRVGLDESILRHEAKRKRVRSIRKVEQAERLERAVATYRGQSSGWQLGIITERELSDERAVYLVAAVDAAARQNIKRLIRAGKQLDQRLKEERLERTALEGQLDDALARMNRLLDKIAASNGTITTIDGELVYVPTGPSPIALLADAADTHLFRLMMANLPPAADGRWLAARHTLALELARAKGVAGNRQEVAAAIERDWDATPTNVLHATLFALRQVGKAYVYATAGPETFDCSGLTKAAYAQVRLGLPHFSGAQLHLGIPVAPEAIRPGDLLTYGPDGSEHVTMAIGGGLVVEAKGRAYGVIVAPARVDPLKGFAGATRIVP